MQKQLPLIFFLAHVCDHHTAVQKYLTYRILANNSTEGLKGTRRCLCASDMVIGCPADDLCPRKATGELGDGWLRA